MFIVVFPFSQRLSYNGTLRKTLLIVYTYANVRSKVHSTTELKCINARNATSSTQNHPNFDLTMQYPIALLLAALLVSQTECLLGVGRLQSVAVRGVLECNGKPAKDVKVKLYEKGRFFDKKLDEKKTDASGSFYLSGSKREITNIDPKVNIYHRCNYHGPCYKKFSITIPDNFISSGSKPQKLFDIGRLNLAGRMPGQTTDCLN